MDAPSTNILALPAGYEFEGYRIERVLGAGGFGITYLAVEKLIERKLAIKEFLPTGIATRGTDGLTVQFVVTDTAKSVPVVYKGILPDLFKEGKGVVTQGQLGPDGVFRASQVLAKHDENYMPPEAAHALSKAEAEKAAKSVVVPSR